MIFEYLNSDLRLNKNVDLLKFCMQQHENFPKLFQLAKQFLIISASKSCVERMFSVSGATITEKRTRLTIERIDKMRYLNRKLVYLRSPHQTNGKELLDDTSYSLFNLNKCALSSGLSSSSLATKRRLSIDDEAILNEQYEQTSYGRLQFNSD